MGRASHAASAALNGPGFFVKSESTVRRAFAAPRQTGGRGKTDGDLQSPVGLPHPPEAASNACAAQKQTAQAQTTQAQQARPSQTQNGQVQNGQRQRGPGQFAALQVSYYSADPLSGGKLLGSVTVQPPPRSAGQTGAANPPTQNPLKAQAPAGAKFAVIEDDHGGARIIDLSQANQVMGGRGFGGPRQNNRGPNGQ